MLQQLNVGAKLERIRDNENNLIAIIVDINKSTEKKNFYTENNNDVQFGVFNLPENEVIENHYHPEQERRLKTTSEVLIILEGEVEATLYDTKLKFLARKILNKGSVLITFTGGHGLKVVKETKLLEVKQGPYNIETDKIRF